MDIQSLIQACADGIASGGLEVLGGSLVSATLLLIRRLRKSSGPDSQERLLAMGELANPERLATDLEQAVKEDPELSSLMEAWVALARDYVEKQAPGGANLTASNYVGSVHATGNVTISQTVNGAQHDS